MAMICRISLPEGIINNRKLFRHKDRDPPDSGLINIKRKYLI
jgi:hypothetical protein